MAYLFIYLYDHEYIQIFILICKRILFYFMLYWVIIGSISYSIFRRKQIYDCNVIPKQYENEIIHSIEQESIVITVPESTDLPVILSNDRKVYKRKSLRPLICYCDGSYSHRNQIGYSGFRASNGFSKYRSCPLRRPRSGSTESEVFAACLALQYTAKYHYDELILYTDNSKVEQLLKRPKHLDYYDYPRFFNALDRCYEGNDDFSIRVEHVHGHPTWYEQEQCSTKREFAKVDRQVRWQRQRHEYKYNNTYGIAYSYRYYNKLGATLIIASN